jgi:iron complex transport system ATP-binding protein
MDFAACQEGGVLVKQNIDPPVIQISSLSATYGDVIALKDINLDVHRGEIVGLIGPNGAGKTTLIKVLSGVMNPSAGEVLINQKGISTYSPSQRARALAVVPQARHLGGAFSVEQAVLLGRTAYLGFLGKPAEEDLLKTAWAMEKTGVDDLADRKLAEISGGEQQRVLLARALAQDTPALLLDEPTNHLDLRYQVNLLKLVKKLVKQEGLSVLMAMHDLNQVSGIADRVMLLANGQMMALGSPKEVLTPENIRKAYQTEIETFTHPKTNKHMIFPVE